MHPIMKSRVLLSIPAILTGCYTASFAGELRPRPQLTKPAHTTLDHRFRDDVITVKFRDDLQIRLRNGALTDTGTGILQGAEDVLAAVAEGLWERSYTLPEAKLDELRQTAQDNLGKVVADPNLRFNLFLPGGVDAAATIDAFNALDCVEMALPVPKPVPSPLPPDYEEYQQPYLHAASGVGASTMWDVEGGTGAEVRIADAEYNWDLDHWEFAYQGAVTLLGDEPTDPSPPEDPLRETNHGTAVLGELGAARNGFGVTGIAHESPLYVVATNTGPGDGVWDVGAAIMTALGTLEPGDVILIEQQMVGPNYTGDPPGTQVGLVPIEWYAPWYDVVVTAVGNGVIVVEAAGNGSQDLDDPIYSTGHGGHWPFLPENDSGAIIVGAGAVYSDTSRSRLWYSNYGSTVDLQGWGENVVTTGYGDLYSSEGQHLWYTQVFAGTSSASPIVAGACACFSSAYQAVSPLVPSPADVQSYLQRAGQAQTSGTYPASQNIGPLPDIPAAWDLLLSEDCTLNGVLDDLEPDCNENGEADSCDIAFGGSFDCNADGVPDECAGTCGNLPSDWAGTRLYVDPQATGANSGVSWNDALSELDAALCLAECNAQVTEVWVAADTYKPGPAVFQAEQAATFDLVDGVALYGGFAGWESSLANRSPAINITTLSGDLNGDDGPDFTNYDDNCYHVITADHCSDATILDGFTITGGNATLGDWSNTTAFGGGMNLVGGGMDTCDPTISNCTFIANDAKHGAGACLFYANPTLTDCYFKDNGRIDDYYGTLGGGMWVDGSSPTLNRCTFEGNAGDFGGGIYLRSPATLTDCKFLGNTVHSGGGAIHHFYANSILTNCLFSGNASDGDGGALRYIAYYSGGLNPTLTNCTFSGNTTSWGQGRAIACDSFNEPGHYYLTNCILWDGGDEIHNDDASTFILTYTNIYGGWTGGDGNIDANPLFIDPDGPDDIIGTADDDLHVPSGSPVVDAGNNDADTDAITAGVQPLPNTDLDGRARFADDPLTEDTGSGTAPIVDMGAYEYQLPADFDADGDVDLDDYDHLYMCLAGPGAETLPTECQDADLDGDTDVDLGDFALFQQQFTGP